MSGEEAGTGHSAEPQATRGAAHPNHWFRHAIVHTSAGTLLGLLTAVLIVVLGNKVFPGLADFDYDMGLRMERFADEHLDFVGQGKEPTKDMAGRDSYLFVDVDPPPERSRDIAAATVSACAAFQARHADRFVLAAGTPEQPGSESAAGRAQLDCSDARPVNRYLLAELVSELKRRGAGLIIVDVELGSGDGNVPATERAALDKVLREPRGDSLPILYVLPAEYDMLHDASGGHLIRVNAQDVEDRSLTASALSAVALPEPGQPVRRYPRCFLSQDVKGAGLPSLPYLANALLVEKQNKDKRANEERQSDGGGLCPPIGSLEAGASYASKRIHYTLPTLRSHQDSTGQGEDFRRWSIYRNVYNRCTVAGLFSPESECGGNALVTGKVVVIGASNPARRDRHYTPLGDMAGAEVVINALRSFALYSTESDKTLQQSLAKKAWIVFVCMFVWFAFFCVKGLLAAPDGAALKMRIARGLLIGAAFSLALLAVLLITFKISYASLSVLIGVLAIGVEQYVEFVTNWVIHPVKLALNRLLKLPLGHT